METLFAFGNEETALTFIGDNIQLKLSAYEITNQPYGLVDIRLMRGAARITATSALTTEMAQSIGRVVCACSAETRDLRASMPARPVAKAVATVQTNLDLQLRIASQTGRARGRLRRARFHQGSYSVPADCLAARERWRGHFHDVYPHPSRCNAPGICTGRDGV